MINSNTYVNREGDFRWIFIEIRTRKRYNNVFEKWRQNNLNRRKKQTDIVFRDIFFLLYHQKYWMNIRDNSKNFGTGQSGSGQFKIFSGRDKRDSGRLKNFRDGTFWIGTIQKFVPQGSSNKPLSFSDSIFHNDHFPDLYV